MHTPNLPWISSTLFRTLRRATVASLVAGLCTWTGAQSSENTDDEKEKEKPVRLDVFEVKSSRDYGYRATNSMTATGSGTAIKDTPLNIAIITKDYLDDKGLNDVRDAVRFTSSMVGTAKDEHEVYARGFESVIKIDGGEENRGAFSLENAERIEIIKGAVSILQGRASAGGVVNIISRKPKFHPEYEIKGSYGSWDQMSASVMATGPLLKDKLAYLVGYSAMEKDSWFDYVYRKQSSAQFAVTYQPVDSLKVTLDMQRNEREETNPQHITMSHPAFLAADLEAIELYDNNGLARPASYPRLGESTRSWLDRTAGFGPTEPAEQIDVTEIMYPRGYRSNVQGPEQHRENESKREVVEVIWNIAPWLDLKSTGYHSRTSLSYLDLSTFRQAGGLTLNVGAGQNTQHQERYDTSHELVSRFELFNTRHRLLLGYQYRFNEGKSQNMSGSGFIYNPRTDGVRYIAQEVAARNPNGFPARNPTEAFENSAYLVDQIEAFDEKLYIMAGARWTERETGDLKADKITPQIGAVFNLPWLKGVGVYASYGESFRPNFVLDAYDNLLPPVEEENIEGGFKFDLKDGLLSGTISYFHLDQKNVPIRDFASEAELGIRPIYILSGLARSEGMEFDFVITPRPNYQIVTSFSRIWQAETVIAQDVRQQGVRLSNTPEAQFSFWNKYTFTRGPLKGLYIGAGARWNDKMSVHPSWSVTLQSDPYWYCDALIGYQIAKWENGRATQVKEFSLRLENLLDETYYDGTFRISEPFRAYATVRLKF